MSLNLNQPLPDPHEVPSGTRLGGRLDDFLAVFGQPLQKSACEAGQLLLFAAGPDATSPKLAALFAGGRAIHLEWRPHGPMRSAILSRVEMLKRWPEDATPEGAFTLRNYESSMNRAASVRLGCALAADLFVDGNGNPVPPGTFTCLATRRGWMMSAGGRLLDAAAY